VNFEEGLIIANNKVVGITSKLLIKRIEELKEEDKLDELLRRL